MKIIFSIIVLFIVLSASLVSSVKAEEGQICILGVICENGLPVRINPEDRCFSENYKVCEKVLLKKMKKEKPLKRKFLRSEKLLYNL